MKKLVLYIIPVLLTVALISALSFKESNLQSGKGVHKVSLKATSGKAIAAFAEGCFWHSEIIFEAIPGVDSVVNGYAGGKTSDPDYEKLETGRTGHAETVLVYYNPKTVSFKQLLKVFYRSHDATQLNRQGNDVGTQYRSIIFYGNEAEHEAAVSAKKQVLISGIKAVTEIAPLKVFYKAENYHQNYIAHNPGNPYVRNVSIPDYKEFRKAYDGPLKKDVIK